VKWLWVCRGNEKTGRIAFSVIKCTKNAFLAHATLRYYKWKRDGWEYWIRKDAEHSDPDYKQYKCPECGNEMSKKELDSTWDWAGPHCNECGCTGMSMFSAVTAAKPIMSGYQGIRKAYASILGWKKMNEIDRKERR